MITAKLLVKYFTRGSHVADLPVKLQLFSRGGELVEYNHHVGFTGLLSFSTPAILLRNQFK